MGLSVQPAPRKARGEEVLPGWAVPGEGDWKLIPRPVGLGCAGPASTVLEPHPIDPHEFIHVFIFRSPSWPYSHHLHSGPLLRPPHRPPLFQSCTCSPFSTQQPEGCISKLHTQSPSFPAPSPPRLFLTKKPFARAKPRSLTSAHKAWQALPHPLLQPPQSSGSLLQEGFEALHRSLTSLPQTLKHTHVLNKFSFFCCLIFKRIFETYGKF